VRILRRLSRTAFYPVPEVDSCLWRIDFSSAARFVADEDDFFRVVRAIYGARRKTLRNALTPEIPRDQLAGVLRQAGIDPGVRGETLGFEGLDAIALAWRAEGVRLDDA
jgi:16S rRNA (adenine1518-N6/adenine1519-N6)-dimethyltransferase